MTINPGTRRKLTSIQRKGGDRTLAKLKGANVYIWSGQWGMYWRPNAAGYTPNKTEAGVYTISDAYEATSHCGWEKRIAYEVVDVQVKP